MSSPGYTVIKIYDITYVLEMLIILHRLTINKLIGKKKNNKTKQLRISKITDIIIPSFS